MLAVKTKNPPILLMDEPTSALDVESGGKVAVSFLEVMRVRTTLMVAHRLGTIQRVNKIMVVEYSQVAEFGTPEELLARQGYYARITGSPWTLEMPAGGRGGINRTDGLFVVRPKLACCGALSVGC